MVALFGRANWWLPGWLARLLRVPAVSAPAAQPAALPPGEPGSGEPVPTQTAVG
jgi:RND superfamily putative drug exporter